MSASANTLLEAVSLDFKLATFVVGDAPGGTGLWYLTNTFAVK